MFLVVVFEALFSHPLSTAERGHFQCKRGRDANWRRCTRVCVRIELCGKNAIFESLALAK